MHGEVPGGLVARTHVHLMRPHLNLTAPPGLPPAALPLKKHWLPLTQVRAQPGFLPAALPRPGTRDLWPDAHIQQHQHD